MSDTILDGNHSDRWFDHAACECTAQPKGRIAFDAGRRSLPEVLRFLHRKMLTLVEVRTRPMPM